MRNSARATYYTVAQAAALLGVSRATVWRWIDAGRLPAYRVGPRRLRIKRENVNAMAEPARASRGPRRASRGPRKDVDRAQIVRGAEVRGRIRLVDPERQADIWANYDVHRVRQALKKAAGALAGVDIGALKEEIHAARRQDSRGRPA